jgi:beta-glucosidase
VRELKAFSKVRLEPGASERVQFRLRRDQLAFIGVANKPIVEPGMFDLWVAPSAEGTGLMGSFELMKG